MKLKYIIIIGCMLIFLSGCSTPRYRKLSSYKDIAQVNRWMLQAKELYMVGEYDSAIMYYQRVIKYYPGTKYSKKAHSKIKSINRFKNIKEFVRTNPALFLGP